MSPGAGIVASGRKAAGGVGVLTFQASAVDGTDGTSYTFAARPIGTADVNRRVVVGIGYAAVGTPVPTVTIGGVTASLDADTGALTGNRRVIIVSAIVPTGTTADVVLTYASTNARVGIGVWTTNGDPTGQTASVPNLDSGTLNVTTLANDMVVAVGYVSNTVALSVNWTGATERFDQNVEGATDAFSGADQVAVGTTTSISFAVAGGGSNQEGFLAAAYRL